MWFPVCVLLPPGLREWAEAAEEDPAWDHFQHCGEQEEAGPGPGRVSRDEDQPRPEERRGDEAQEEVDDGRPHHGR